MKTLDCIAGRRSIRKFKDIPLPDEVIRQILLAGTLAPSGKNRQPWHFYVVKQDKREEMVAVLEAAIEKSKAEGERPGSGENTARIMRQAPVTIFVFNPLLENADQLPEDMPTLRNIVDVQSVGACIQNMNLAAYDLDIGVLWICDVFRAYYELCDWLGETHQMIAAVSLGYADEAPAARPRKSVEEVTTWL